MYCGQIADAYIENDHMITLIDVILLRTQAFRHVLYNTDFREHWTLKLIAFSCLAEAYHHWALEHSDQQAITAAIEFSFYMKLTAAVLGVIGQTLTALILLALFSPSIKGSYEEQKMRAQCIALSNYSVLYLIVIHIWSAPSALYGYYLLKLYKAATCFVAMKTMTTAHPLALATTSILSCGIDLWMNLH
ncbi:protein ARV1-like isoform X2 [Watersipora subatra]|uniref:protein ARV1-like isoform X2 n=1 Tax=Watersipora subatra TaxID=2589382 RepID=UPI00355C019E